MTKFQTWIEDVLIFIAVHLGVILGSVGFLLLIGFFAHIVPQGK